MCINQLSSSIIATNLEDRAEQLQEALRVRQLQLKERGTIPGTQSISTPIPSIMPSQQVVLRSTIHRTWRYRRQAQAEAVLGKGTVDKTPRLHQDNTPRCKNLVKTCTAHLARNNQPKCAECSQQVVNTCKFKAILVRKRCKRTLPSLQVSSRSC
jgi:hypothetical protein